MDEIGELEDAECAIVAELPARRRSGREKQEEAHVKDDAKLEQGIADDG